MQSLVALLGNPEGYRKFFCSVLAAGRPIPPTSPTHPPLREEEGEEEEAEEEEEEEAAEEAEETEHSFLQGESL